MAGVIIASSSAKDICADQTRLCSIMSGEQIAFISQTPNKDNIKFTGKAFDKEAKDAQSYAKAAYEFAATRDAFSCIAGRKYIRRQAVVSKLLADLNRIIALKQIETERPGT